MDPDGHHILGVRMTAKPVSLALTLVGGPEKVNASKKRKAISGPSRYVVKATKNPF